MQVRRRRNRWYLAVLVVIALGAALIATPALPTSSAATGCVDPYPISDVRPGLIGTGWTVSKGTTPEPFSAEVLGVLNDALMPGKDLILVDTESPAIDAAGGVWFGMSGSPVYIGGRLLGAVSWSVSYGMSSVIGLTPAADLIEVTEYVPGQVDSRQPLRIPLSETLQKRVDELSSLDGDEVRTAIVPLRIPVSISGASTRSDDLARTLRQRGMRLVPYAGSAASSTFLPNAPLHAGDSVGVAWSFGDLTIGATGTVAYVCGNQAVLFGHSIWGFYPGGQTSMGGAEAPVIGVLPDPVWGSPRVSIMGSPSGRVDQDRFSGLRMIMGEAPPSIPVRTTVTATTTGRVRSAAADVTQNSWVADVASWTLASNVDVAYDHRAQGSASLDFTITGTRASGEAFELTRSELVTSDWDIAQDVSMALFRFPHKLQRNRFEDIDFTGITVSASVGHDLHKARVVKVLSAVGAGSSFGNNLDLFVGPGQTIRLKVLLRDLQNGDVSTVGLRIAAPLEFGSAVLQVGGGGDLRRRVPNRSFDELLGNLQNLFRNNDVVALMGGSNGAEPVGDARRTMDSVVTGSRAINVIVGEVGLRR